MAYITQMRHDITPNFISQGTAAANSAVMMNKVLYAMQRQLEV